MTDLTKISTYAQKCYDESNCKYDGKNYFVHIQMVVDFSMKYMGVFRKTEDARVSVGGALGHDLMEETKESYNNILAVCGKEVADVVLALTDVPATSRLMKHLLTMGKTVQNYIAIIDKMYDMGANASYSKSHKSSMYSKYVAEYAYRKPIFQMALVWYKDELDQDMLAQLWKELDEIHTPNLK
jgi:(p)ppGpp synthase/HD superfamily hydrolase